MRLRLSLSTAFVLCTIGCSVPISGPATPETIPSSGPLPSESTQPSSLVTATPPASYRLSGRIFDDDLAGIGATIRVQPDGGTPILTKALGDGRYELNLAAGTYRVSAEREGWTTRTQATTLTADSVLNFGGVDSDGSNPYFLSDTPEIASADVKEDAPGGPMEIRVTLSEPITKDSQSAFERRFRVMTGAATPFLYANGASESFLQAKVSWDVAGKVFTLRFAEPYLASGEEPAPYTVKLIQEPLDERDPVTQERKWDPLGILGLDGSVLANNRADQAFARTELSTILLSQLANKELGYDHKARRWAMTHQSGVTFMAAKDMTPPGLVSAQVYKNRKIGVNDERDVLELRLTEPLRVVRSQSEMEFTRLAKDKQLVVINASTNADGSAAKSFGFNFTDLRFSRTEANLVVLHYPANAFKDMRWVEVNLGPDFKDPAGNVSDPKRSRGLAIIN